jgi:hypothetical protein
MAQINEGSFRIGAMYGEVWRAGRLLAEVTNISATIERARTEMPLVGTTKTGYKFGRETQEGTLTIQKIDSRWENEVHSQLSHTLAERRAARRAGELLVAPFNLQLELDDPDALGWEAWQLSGCLLYRLTLGHDVSDDVVSREIPFTFEGLQPLANFVRTGAIDPVTGLPSVTQTDIRS